MYNCTSLFESNANIWEDRIFILAMSDINVD
jgi:hypothetical protein